MSKTSKQSQIEDLQAQLADSQAQLAAERNTILDLESRLADYEQRITIASEGITKSIRLVTENAIEQAKAIDGLEEEVENAEAQRDRAVKLATDLSATLVKAVVFGTRED